jgi:alanine racemase
VSLVLRVDKKAWDARVDRLRAEFPGFVPVAKGNGYGWGMARAATAAQEAGFGCLAVGLPTEIPLVAREFSGDILVLTPWAEGIGDDWSALSGADLRGRVVATVSDLAALEAAAAGRGPGRYVLELRTEMLRFGLPEPDFGPAGDVLSAAPVLPEALSVHLPLDGTDIPKLAATVCRALESGIAAAKLQASHLTVAQCAELADRTGLAVEQRIGTRLWLGDVVSLTGTVRAVHEVGRGQRVGYHQVKVPGAGHLLVVDGGTSHGVALAAPQMGGNLVAQAKTLAEDMLERGGYVRSPFTLDGTHLRFAEPPHAQVSLLWLPRGARVPEPGEELPVRARLTTIHPDTVEFVCGCTP